MLHKNVDNLYYRQQLITNDSVRQAKINNELKENRNDIRISQIADIIFKILCLIICLVLLYGLKFILI